MYHMRLKSTYGGARLQQASRPTSGGTTEALSLLEGNALAKLSVGDDHMVNGLALSHANFFVPDLERHVAYYEEVIGLQNAGRADGRVYLGAPSGGDALILSEGQHTALAGLAFICEPDKSVE